MRIEYEHALSCLVSAAVLQDSNEALKVLGIASTGQPIDPPLFYGGLAYGCIHIDALLLIVGQSVLQHRQLLLLGLPDSDLPGSPV